MLCKPSEKKKKENTLSSQNFTVLKMLWFCLKVLHQWGNVSSHKLGVNLNFPLLQTSNSPFIPFLVSQVQNVLVFFFGVYCLWDMSSLELLNVLNKYRKTILVTLWLRSNLWQGRDSVELKFGEGVISSCLEGSRDAEVYCRWILTSQLTESRKGNCLNPSLLSPSLSFPSSV